MWLCSYIQQNVAVPSMRHALRKTATLLVLGTLLLGQTAFANHIEGCWYARVSRQAPFFLLSYYANKEAAKTAVIQYFENRYGGTQICDYPPRTINAISLAVPCFTCDWDVGALLFVYGVHNSTPDMFCSIFLGDVTLTDGTHSPPSGPLTPPELASGCVSYTVRLSALNGSEVGRLTSIEPGKNVSLIARVYDKNGVVAPNVNIKLIVDVLPNSGGHRHDEGRHSNSISENRAGKLAPLPGMTATISDNGKILEGNTQQNGLRFTFTAPALAGDHKITASCTDGKSCQTEGPNMVWVGVKDLVPLPGSDVYVLLPNVNDPKHPDNHYMTYAAMLRVTSLAALYHGQFPDDPLLHLNDASLERGGLFDYKAKDGAAWKPPHETHREGIHVDIRANPDINSDTAIPVKNFKDFVEIAKKAGGIAQLHNVGTSTQHYHVRF